MNSDLNPNPNPLYTPVQPQNQVPKGIGNRTTLPFVLIIGGALLQLYASGLVGTPNAAFLERAWGIVILAAGLDFLLVQRRFISGSVLSLMGGILLILNFGGDSAAPLSEIFYRFWPLLLIAYGVDIILRSRLISAVLSFVFVGGAILLIILISNGALTLPNIRLPENFTLPKGMGELSLPSIGAKPISYAYPEHNAAKLLLHIPSGKLDLRGGELSENALSGEIRVAAGETFNQSEDLSGALAVYSLSASANDGAKLEFGQLAQSEANWKLTVNKTLPLTLETTIENGYQLINLSQIALHSAIITSLNGNTDVRLPYQSQNPIVLDNQNGSLRIFVPQGVAAFVTVNSGASVTFPDDYLQTGNQVYPNSELSNVGTTYQVTVNATALNGTITIVNSQN